MARTKLLLNSERPVEELISLSQSLADNFFRHVYGRIKIGSPILNPAAKRMVPSDVAFLDLNGLKALLTKYRATNGKIALEEFNLRELWRRWEYLRRCNGKDVNTLPTGKEAEDIAQVAVFVKIALEEASNLEKSIKEGDAKEAKERQTRRFGSCKRDTNGKIWQVDGMAVNKKGLIEESGQHVDEYLAEVAAERKLKWESRKTASAA